MSFNSISFLVFFTTVVIAYFALPHRLRWILLLAGSYFFYGYCQPGYLALIMATTMVSFAFAKAMQDAGTQRKKRILLGLCIGLNVSVLLVFKYYNFFGTSITALLSSINVSVNIPRIDLLLPLGISFYTFRTVSYLVDVYRGKVGAEKHLGVFALYVSFFPQLIAGPIERSPHLIPQLHERKTFDPEKFTEGFTLMLWGFFMKLVIADRIGVYVNAVFNNPHAYSGGHCLLASYLFTYQIFCDFAGYSSIAVGASRIFGYDLVINFRRPYFSRSLREFWTRWHISLSTWFRDYLYIPLGGNRVSRAQHVLNLAVVFLVSGLWHGANWTFVAWGGIHGLGVILAEWTSGFRKRAVTIMGLKNHGQLAAIVQVVLTFHMVSMAWVFFRASSIAEAWTIVTKIFSGWQFNLNYAGLVILPFTNDSSAVAAFLVSVLFIAFMQYVEFINETGDARILKLWRSSGRFRGGCLVGLALIILLFGEFSSTTFIYRQF